MVAKCTSLTGYVELYHKVVWKMVKLGTVQPFLRNLKLWFRTLHPSNSNTNSRNSDFRIALTQYGSVYLLEKLVILHDMCRGILHMQYLIAFTRNQPMPDLKQSLLLRGLRYTLSVIIHNVRNCGQVNITSFTRIYILRRFTKQKTKGL